MVMEVSISVIVPVYNVEQYLARCLDSIVNQSFKNLEIICINDGSTDNSLEILKNYAAKDPRILIIDQENKGQAAARNEGLKSAHGKYIGFVDSDDWIDPNFFEMLYNAAEKYQADSACCSIKRPHKSGRTPLKLNYTEEKVLRTCAEKYKVLEIPRRCYIWNKIYRRDELERQYLNFVEGVLFEDIYFIVRFFYYSKNAVVIPGTYYNYWVNNKSTTRDMKDKNQIDILAARADFIKFSREHHIICDESFYIKRKITYKFLGIPILRIYEWETIKKYYLFGLLPVLEKRISL